jgi:hypothetical protein
LKCWRARDVCAYIHVPPTILTLSRPLNRFYGPGQIERRARAAFESAEAAQAAAAAQWNPSPVKIQGELISTWVAEIRAMRDAARRIPYAIREATRLSHAMASH